MPLGALVADVLKASLPVAVANEADLGLLAECRRGAAVGAADVVYVSAEAGVGGGVLVGGRPSRRRRVCGGARSSAGPPRR